MAWAARQKGFTIVELLIVIVVIAILATISIVAYRGIQDRANDAAIQSDLSNFAKKIQLAASDTGDFPAAGATQVSGTSTGNSTAFPGFVFLPSKSAYMATMNNLYYCTGTETASGQKIFRILAKSKSGNLFEYTPGGGVKSTGTANPSTSSACQGMSDPQTWAYGYHPINGWYTWTNG